MAIQVVKELDTRGVYVDMAMSSRDTFERYKRRSDRRMSEVQLPGGEV